MSGFDPDAYLGTPSSQSAPFNPDAYLAELKPPDPAISRETDQPIQSGGPISYMMGKANQWMSGELVKGAKWLGMTDPASLRDVGNIPAAVESVYGGKAISAPLGAITDKVGGWVNRSAPEEVPSSPLTAQEIADRSASSSPQSMGASAAAPSLADASPQLQQAVVDAARKTGGAVNSQALINHAEADAHGVQLTEGQATRDPITFSNERNSTNPAILKRFNDQEQQMTDAIDNIRQQAGPTTVGNNPIQNGQIVVDSLKNYDAPIKADITAKYNAANAASADGSMQMDGSSFVSNANAALKPQSKYRFLPSSVQGILDDVQGNNGKMSLDDFQAYDTQLGNEIAKAQRSGDGNAVYAVGQVKQALGNVQPVDAETAQAKALFDTARSAAKARFDALDADPAYQAAVEDPTKVGQPSPIADKFLDKYALNAPKANLDLMTSKLDPEAQQAVASHALSSIRNQAVTPNGTVSPNGYNRALRTLGPKLNSLVDPDTAESLDSLGRVITNAKVPPTANFVNNSKSGVLMNAASGVSNEIGGALLNAKTMGLGLPIVKGLAERSFANRVLAPGAGLSKLSDLVNSKP